VAAAPIPPQQQPRRPQRNAGLPQRFNDCEVDLPGHNSDSDEEPSVDDDEEELPVDTHIRSIHVGLNRAVQKLEKYVVLLHNTPVYWAAMILHPGIRGRWIEHTLDADTALAIMATFKQSFLKDYGQIDPPTATLPQPRNPLPPRFATLNLSPNFYDDDDDDDYGAIDPAEELQNYLSAKMRPVTDILSWWRKEEEHWPRLSRMAFDILSIPAVSAECERAFSTAKLTIPALRNSLGPEVISKLQCLKNWLKTGDGDDVVNVAGFVGDPARII
jgi:hypothetical protein